MNWQEESKNKFNKGISGMSTESDSFVKLLTDFNAKSGIETEMPFNHGSLLPEGAVWLLKLKNGDEILAELCSYQVKSGDGEYVWIEFDPDSKKLTAEINKKNAEVTTHELLSENDIVDFYPGING